MSSPLGRYRLSSPLVFSTFPGLSRHRGCQRLLQQCHNSCFLLALVPTQLAHFELTEPVFGTDGATHCTDRVMNQLVDLGLVGDEIRVLLVARAKRLKAHALFDGAMQELKDLAASLHHRKIFARRDLGEFRKRGGPAEQRWLPGAVHDQIRVVAPNAAAAIREWRTTRLAAPNPVANAAGRNEVP